ncbi:MAG: AAA family ATPase [Fusobacteriaceae bacterium]|nr:AAA family ATPase [Fusobacteriaceae bacterium]
MSNFLITNEYLRFKEFCDNCKKFNYIGLCYGIPGVGKTLSARYYSNWNIIESIIPPQHLQNPLPVDKLESCDTIFYTAPVSPSPARIEREIKDLCFNLNCLNEDIIVKSKIKGLWEKQKNHIKLIIIDEADRLRPVSLEQIRDIYDSKKIAVAFIGMPGIENKLSRYAQLYSRIGHIHNFRQLSNKEIHIVLENKLHQFGIEFDATKKSENEAITEIIRKSRFNFRLMQRLLTQISNIMEINNIRNLNIDVVETARENLIIGD